MNENKKIYNLRMTIVKCVGVGAQNENVGMRSMQELSFWLNGLRWHGAPCVPNVSFLYP